MIWLFAAALLLAYANGANDNLKGVATLFGSRTASYRTALWAATVTTLAGSLCSLILAHGLVQSFSGKGLVPDALAASPNLLLAVAVGTGATVMLATVFGFPVSTTHGMLGALTGAGFVASGTAIQLSALTTSFLAPLLISPLLAMVLSVLLYRSLHRARLGLGISETSCVCVGAAQPVLVHHGRPSLSAGTAAVVSVSEEHVCTRRYAGRMLGFNIQTLLDGSHLASAGLWASRAA